MASDEKSLPLRKRSLDDTDESAESSEHRSKTAITEGSRWSSEQPAKQTTPLHSLANEGAICVFISLPDGDPLLMTVTPTTSTSSVHYDAVKQALELGHEHLTIQNTVLKTTDRQSAFVSGSSAIGTVLNVTEGSTLRLELKRPFPPPFVSLPFP